MKNFHLPLREQTYDRLRAAVVPVTTLAREAIDLCLRQGWRQARHDAIEAYATEMAGSKFDIDPDPESAGIEHLVSGGKVKVGTQTNQNRLPADAARSFASGSNLEFRFEHVAAGIVARSAASSQEPPPPWRRSAHNPPSSCHRHPVALRRAASW